MKLLHLADLHLGRSLGEFDLKEDQEDILKKIVDIINDKKIDAVLIAGDVYDKAIPSETATNLFNSFLNDLAELKVETFIISGNHDSDERLNFGSKLFEESNVHISAIFDGKMKKYTKEDQYGKVNFYLLPFVKASQVRHFYPELQIDSYDEAVKAVINNTDIEENERNVILSHQFVAGTHISGSESVAVQHVGLVEQIGYDCFEKFDYAALGHIHSAQKIGKETIRYSGSPLKYSVSEINNEKSVPVISLGGKGNIDIELVPLVPKRELVHLKDKLEVIMDKRNVVNAEDFVYVTLTDENTVNDAMSIIQQVYPYAIKLDYDNAYTRAVEHVDVADIVENRSFNDLISEFYKVMYNVDISEEELSIMREVAKEARIIDEAD